MEQLCLCPLPRSKRSNSFERIPANTSDRAPNNPVPDNSPFLIDFPVFYGLIPTTFSNVCKNHCLDKTTPDWTDAFRLDKLLLNPNPTLDTTVLYPIFLWGI